MPRPERADLRAGRQGYKGRVLRDRPDLTERRGTRLPRVPPSQKCRIAR